MTNRLKTVFIVLSAWLLAAICPALGASAEEAISSEFVRGYATAVLERIEGSRNYIVEFKDQLLRVEFDRQPASSFDSILDELLAIDGVAVIEITIDEIVVAEASKGDRAIASATDNRDATESAPAERGDVIDESSDPEQPRNLFPPGELFAPLLADPRWPHFSASHLWYLSGDDIERVGSVVFGESMSLVRSSESSWGQFELGLQAGVFSAFDLERGSSELVNSDYLVGLTATHRQGEITSMLRYYHQSSHLGDEYLIRTDAQRIGLSFEVLDLLVSAEPLKWLRLYGGGGLLIHRSPALERGLLQTGVELQGVGVMQGDYVRPILGADFQFREEHDWKGDVSIRGGVQIVHPLFSWTRIQVLAEYYSGRSPDGQFYERRIETIGLGVHLGI